MTDEEVFEFLFDYIHTQAHLRNMRRRIEAMDDTYHSPSFEYSGSFGTGDPKSPVEIAVAKKDELRNEYLAEKKAFDDKDEYLHFWMNFHYRAYGEAIDCIKARFIHGDHWDQIARYELKTSNVSTAYMCVDRMCEKLTGKKLNTIKKSRHFVKTVKD